MSLITAAESGWVPDGIIRFGIRRLVRQRLREERQLAATARAQRLAALRDSPIALHTDTANEQHYELPTEFFALTLGPHLKYSACIFPSADADLGEAERHTFKLYSDRLGIAPGDRVLDLGCGWGSFSLWLAQQEPTVHITAVSNSSRQRQFIEHQVAEFGLNNLQVFTADANTLELPGGSFDKAISVEMFEHVRNYQRLLGKISRWLTADGVLFTHIFCHKHLLYPFETDGEDNWMGRYFFTGGLMPAADTLPQFQDDLTLEAQWMHDGSHYQRTARAWLENLDRNADAALECLADTYGGAQAQVWLQRWRMFFMSCEEMFAYDHGDQWQVAHYRFRNGG